MGTVLIFFMTGAQSIAFGQQQNYFLVSACGYKPLQYNIANHANCDSQSDSRDLDITQHDTFLH